MLLFTRLMEPPDIFVTTPVAPVKPNEGVVAQPPATQIFTAPPDWVYVMYVAELVRRPATFRVPPSTVNDAPFPAPITWVPRVPTPNVPSVTRSRPAFVGEPACPTIVALALFSQMAPVAGMVYAAAAKTGFENVLEPLILNVPFAIVRNPATLRPCTVIVPPGMKSRVEAPLVPLLSVTPLKSSVPLLANTASAAPVNVIPAPAVSALVLKSSVPAFVRWPPATSRCPVWVPVAADWRAPPDATVMLPFAVSVRAIASSYWSTPPLTTVRLRAEAAVSIVTVQPFVIVTLSAPVGTTPPDHVEPELQSPPGATQEISSRATNGGVPNALPRRRSRLVGRFPAGVAGDCACAARLFGTAAGRAKRALERCARAGACATATACSAVTTGAAGAAGTATGAVRFGLVIATRAVLAPVCEEGGAAGAEPIKLSATSATSETKAKRKPRCRDGPDRKRMDFKRVPPQ